MKACFLELLMNLQLFINKKCQEIYACLSLCLPVCFHICPHVAAGNNIVNQIHRTQEKRCATWTK